LVLVQKPFHRRAFSKWWLSDWVVLAEEVKLTRGQRVARKEERRTILVVTRRELERIILEKRSQHDCFEEAHYWMAGAEH
jgi:hypothetical protein